MFNTVSDKTTKTYTWDYRSTANVQIHIYYNRLEIITPGGLPAGMKAKDLGVKSVPRNPLLFDMFYRMDLVDQIGNGINRIKELCQKSGVRIPVFDVSDNWFTIVSYRQVGEVTGEVTGEVMRLLSVMDGELKRRVMQEKLKLKHEDHFREAYLLPALKNGFIEMTIPDKPRSQNQKYRITNKGKDLISKAMDKQDEE